MRLEGEIKGKPLIADWQAVAGNREPDANAWKPVSGFRPEAEAFGFAQNVDLRPGRQRVFLRARGADKAPESTPVVTLDVEYHPRVPKLERLLGVSSSTRP